MDRTLVIKLGTRLPSLTSALKALASGSVSDKSTKGSALLDVCPHSAQRVVKTSVPRRGFANAGSTSFPLCDLCRLPASSGSPSGGT